MAKITNTRNVGSSGTQLTPEQIKILEAEAAVDAAVDASTTPLAPGSQAIEADPFEGFGGRSQYNVANPDGSPMPRPPSREVNSDEALSVFSGMQPQENIAPGQEAVSSAISSFSSNDLLDQENRPAVVGPSEQSLDEDLPEEYANTPFQDEQGRLTNDPLEKRRLYNKQQADSAQAISRPTLNVDLTKLQDIKSKVGNYISASDQGKVQMVAVKLSDKLAQITTRPEQGGVLNVTSEGTSPNQSGWDAVASVLGSDVDPREALTASINAGTTTAYEMLGEEVFNQQKEYDSDETSEIDFKELMFSDVQEDQEVVNYGLTPKLFKSRLGNYIKTALRNNRISQGLPTGSIDAADPELLGTLVGDRMMDLSEFKIMKSINTGEDVLYPSSTGIEFIRANAEFALATVSPVKLPRVTIPATEGKNFLPGFLERARNPSKSRIGALDKETRANKKVNAYGVRLDRVRVTSTPEQIGLMSLLVRLGTANFEGSDVFANMLGIGSDKENQIRATGVSDKKLASHMAREKEKAIRAIINYAQIESSGQAEFGRKSVDATVLRFYETNTRIDAANPYNRALQNFKSDIKVKIPKNSFDNVSNNSEKYFNYMINGGTKKGVPADPELAVAHFLFAHSSVLLGEQSRNIRPDARLKLLTPEIISEGVKRGKILKSISNKLSFKNPTSNLTNLNSVVRFLPTLDDKGRLPFNSKTGQHIVTPMETPMPKLSAEEAQFLTNISKNTKLKELGFYISTLIDLANMDEARVNGTYHTPTGVNDMDLNSGGPTIVDFNAGSRVNALHAGLVVNAESINTLENGDLREFFLNTLDDYLGDSSKRNKLFKNGNISFSEIPNAAKAMQDALAVLTQADAKEIAKKPLTIDAYGFPVTNHGNTARELLNKYPTLYEALSPFYTYQGEVNLTNMSSDFADMFAAVLMHNKIQSASTGIKRAAKSVQRWGEFLSPKDRLGLPIPIGSEGLVPMLSGETIVVTDNKGNETRIPNKVRGKDLLRKSKDKKVKTASGETILYSAPEGSLSANRAVVITGQRGEAQVMLEAFEEVNPDIENKLTHPAIQVFDNINASSSSYGNYYFAANRPGGAIDKSLEFNQLKAFYDNYSETMDKIKTKLVEMAKDKVPLNIGRNGSFSYLMADADANHAKLVSRKEAKENFSYFNQYDKIFRAMGWVSPEERGATPDSPTLNFNLDVEKALRTNVTISRGGARDPKNITMNAFKALAYMDNITKYKEDLYNRLDDHEINKKKVKNTFKGFLN